MCYSAENLPAEVLLKIFSYCSFDDLVLSVQYVCSWWQEVSRDRYLWKWISFRPTCMISSKEVVELLKISPRLQIADFSNHHVDSDIIQALIEKCPELEQLCVSAGIIDHMNNLQITQQCSNVKVLILTGKDDQYSNVLKYLRSGFPRLEHLELESFHFSKDDLVFFLNKKQIQLQTLSVPCRTLDGYCTLPYLSTCIKLKNLGLLYLCSDFEQIGLLNLENIMSLTIDISSISGIDRNLTVFSYFPKLIELQLSSCSICGDNVFKILANTFPLLEKLTVSNCFSLLEDSSLRNLHYFKRMKSLAIRNNNYITDWGIYQLLGISELKYIDLYDCEHVTVQCLKLICTFSKLQVLKFDLQFRDFPFDLTSSDIKNQNLQLMFYRCKDITNLEYLKVQNLRVSVLGDKIASFGTTEISRNRSEIDEAPMLPKYGLNITEQHLRRFGRPDLPSGSGGKVMVLVGHFRGNYEGMKDRALLAPLNKDVDRINYDIPTKLPRKYKMHQSYDSIKDQPEGAFQFTTEFLISVNISDLPRHKF